MTAQGRVVVHGGRERDDRQRIDESSTEDRTCHCLAQFKFSLEY